MTEVIVLCYHALSPTWEAALSTTPERFERQMRLLTGRGYRGVTFTEAVSAPPRGRVVAVTFDDAYRSVLELARPILDGFGLPATVFAPTDFVGSEAPQLWSGIDRWHGGPHALDLVPMSWPELQSLADAGWEIGSHTGSHPHLTQIGDRELEDELTRSKSACEDHLGGSCTSLAYPYGDFDTRVVAATARAGYRAGAALPRLQYSLDVMQWPRIGIHRVDHDFRFRIKVSPAVRQLRRILAPDSPAVPSRVVERLRKRARPPQADRDA